MCAQQCKCPGCGKWKAKKKFQRHETCSDCRSSAQQKDGLPASPLATAASVPQPLFEHGDIILLHKMKRDEAAIANEVACDV
jgi:hypothetical protein